jgi:hypothetical protein
MRSVWFPAEFLTGDNTSWAGTSGIRFPPFDEAVQQLGATLEAGVIIADWLENVSCSEGQGAQM